MAGRPKQIFVVESSLAAGLRDVFTRQENMYRQVGDLAVAHQAGVQALAALRDEFEAKLKEVQAATVGLAVEDSGGPTWDVDIGPAQIRFKRRKAR